MRKSLLTVTIGALAAAVPAYAGDFALGPTTVASGVSPFAPGCGGPGEASPQHPLSERGGGDTHRRQSDQRQQHRRLLAAGPLVGRRRARKPRGLLLRRRSHLGHKRAALFPMRGRGRLGNAGDYQRATDPWLSFSPNGRLHAISLVFDNSTARNAVFAAFSDNSGATWSTPRVLRFDNPRAVGNNFNDKETLTADPFDSILVYATWQRIVSPSEQASAKGYENAASFFSAAWFARSTNGGESLGAGAGDLCGSRQVHADHRQHRRRAARTARSSTASI